MIALFLFAIHCVSSSFAVENRPIRMPGKLYGQALSVKIQLTMPTFTATVPMWVNLNSKKSTVDKMVLQEMGFLFKDKKFQPLLTEVADKYFPKFTFDFAKSETAIVPNFAQSCCAGTLGLDFFNQGYLVVDYNDPAGVDWIQSGTPSAEIIADTESVDFSKVPFQNLGLSPFVFSKNKWVFRDRVVIYDLQKKKAYIKKNPETVIAVPTIQFKLVPPDRAVQITSLGKDPLSMFLAKNGIKSGMLLKLCNGMVAEKTSKPDLDWVFFTASKFNKKLELVFAKKAHAPIGEWVTLNWPAQK